MKTITHGSLFSGIGGFDLAAEWMGWINEFHCEVDPFCQQVLKYYWTNAESYDDIKKTDFTIWNGRIDVLTGGFPCQPYSLAGKRKGKEDERHLWPEMLRAIREIQPCWVVGENVLGIVNWNGGMVFNEVQADLEAEGYEVFPYVLPACALNAPHRRDRVWFVAYKDSNQNGWGGVIRKEESEIGRFGNIGTGNNEWISSNNGEVEDAANTSLSNEQRNRICQVCKGWEIGGCDCTYNASDTPCKRQSGKEYRKTKSGWVTKKSIPTDWQNFPIKSPVCDGDDGFSTRLDGITFPKWRNESIKAGGNAIVPQVALQIFKAIYEYGNR